MSRMPARFGRFVLNEGAAGGGERPARSAEDLQRLMLAARRAHSTAGGAVDYGRLGRSREWRGAVEAADGLRTVDPRALGGSEERLAFWINVYNALVFHGIVALGVRRSVREVRNFFGRVAYRVGPFVLSADDVEHGILRGNARRLFPPLRCFGRSDPRRALSLPRVDPRFHFAVTCGARSCPAVGLWGASAIDAQLDLATRSFLNQEVALGDDGRVLCSKILRWYRRDFDAVGGLAAFLLRHLDDGPARRALAAGATPCRAFRPYDWDLQHGWAG